MPETTAQVANPLASAPAPEPEPEPTRDSEHSQKMEPEPEPAASAPTPSQLGYIDLTAKTLTGQTFQLQARPTDTIASVKAQINGQAEIPRRSSGSSSTAPTWRTSARWPTAAWSTARRSRWS